MKSMDLLETIGSIQDRYILEARNQKVTHKKRVPSRRLFLIAAIIALMLLLVGCAVIYMLSMQNIKLGVQQEVYEIFSDDGSEYQRQETVTEQVLTLAGIKGTPGYQAAQEWFEFKQNYDSDGAILASVWRNTPEFPAEYSRYGLYSQEMKDKVDAILKKYCLKPAGAILEFRTLKNMCAALGVERIQTASNDVSVLIESGECHENGNFSMMVDFTLPDSADAEITSTWGLLRWNRTDCFSDDMIALEAVDDWQEWNYTTVSGSEVLIIRSSSDARGWIICDRGEAMLSLQLEARQDLYSDAGVEYRYLTDNQMELIADAIDFSIQPRVATQENVANQPGAPVSATQNGYTLTLKSVETDGYVVRILVGIASPEGTDIESLDIGIGNHGCLTPVSDPMWGNSHISDISDNDGLPNTKDMLIITSFDGKDGSMPCAKGSTWNLSILDLWVDKYRDTERLLVEGEWTFPITFDENNGDYKEIELISEPITAKACIGWREDGTDALADRVITSFKLRKFGYDIEFEETREHDYAEFSWTGHFIYAVTKDGTQVDLSMLKWQPLDLNQVDYVLMVDGTKLMMPETQDSDTVGNYKAEDWTGAKTKYEEILAGKDVFLNRDQAEGMTIAQYCKSIGTAAEVDFRITQFALSDLDHDGTPELILWENINGVDDCGFLVIRYDGNGGAVGYEFSYRQLVDLKYDGTFGYSGGVASTGFATLVFNDTGWEYDIFGCVEENDSGVSFKWGDSLLSEEEYWSCAQKQSAKETVQWMPYPADSYDLSYND